MEVQESKQVGGTHYSCMKYQPIDLIIKLDLDFIQGCIVKYLSRHKNKNGKEDIEKAIQYMEFGLKSGKRMACNPAYFDELEKYCEANSLDEEEKITLNFALFRSFSYAIDWANKIKARYEEHI